MYESRAKTQICEHVAQRTNLPIRAQRGWLALATVIVAQVGFTRALQ